MRALSLRGLLIARRSRLEVLRRVFAITTGNRLAPHRAPHGLLPGNTAQSISVTTNESLRGQLLYLCPARTRLFLPARALHRSSSVPDFFGAWRYPSSHDIRWRRSRCAPEMQRFPPLA